MKYTIPGIISRLRFNPARFKKAREIIGSQSPMFRGNEMSLNKAGSIISKSGSKPVKMSEMIEKFEMPRFLLRIMPNMLRATEQSLISSESISGNPENPKMEADKSFLEEIEDIARNLNCRAIGYARVPDELIFRNKAIKYRNAIVLTLDMDTVKITKAPSIDSMETVFQSYADLGEAVNVIADKLRNNGYGAHADPAISGEVHYPELAQLAGLGYRGRNGLLISEAIGCSQRIAAVYTSIENLPFSKENKYSWVRDFCSSCGKCIKECPTNAIFDEPIKYANNNYLKFVDEEKCRMSFIKYGCSICVKICPFISQDYEEINMIYNSKLKAVN